MIASLKYVMCDVCGDPAAPADTTDEAKKLAREEGYEFRTRELHQRAICRKCQELDALRVHPPR